MPASNTRHKKIVRAAALTVAWMNERPGRAIRNIAREVGVPPAHLRNILSVMAAKTSKKIRRTAGTARSRGARKVSMPFTRGNYLLMVAGLVSVLIGYVIMRLENEVDGFVSLYVAPVLLLVGYLEILYAIWWRGPEEQAAQSAE